MGCDIHAMMERIAFNEAPEEGERPVFEGLWENAGDPDILRNYNLFAVLGNVRNRFDLPFIAQNRGVPEYCSDVYECWVECNKGFAHSHSWVTLAELKAFDVNQTYFDPRYILRDADGERVGVTYASPTSEETLEPVGETTIFGALGDADWRKLIDALEEVKRPYHTDDDVRVCFWFDN